MNDSLVTALETYGLVGADGDGSEADINTDIQEMLQVFNARQEVFDYVVHKVCRHLVDARHLCSSSSFGFEVSDRAMHLDFAEFCTVFFVLLHESQVFKPGKPLKFSCTFDAKPKPETDDALVEDATVADATVADATVADSA